MLAKSVLPLALRRPVETSYFLSDCNGIRTHNHLVRQPTFNHLAQLAKWLSCIVSTYMYRAFDCLFLSYHIRVLKQHNKNTQPNTP